ncbi:methylenetetrahydrofolate reductase [Occultella kanbiaonis]|uniref:methylenetetrahydrofolate reductase n=1 Tax=Occultella kanbiaonis TaxID=2675754 RepID=UPI0012B74F2E|nr:methylenetetrahydrofolate reductase [Occultella kanbiaonis]
MTAGVSVGAGRADVNDGVDRASSPWPGPVGAGLGNTAIGAPAAPPSAAAQEVRAILARRPLVLTGLPVPPLDSGAFAVAADHLAGVADAVLTGDSARARVQFPPSYRAALMQQHGLRGWLGINCRDRNRVAIEGELLAIADSGAAGVLCVTGDPVTAGHRPDAKGVFDLDGISAAHLASRAGLFTAVPEAPVSAPVQGRALRALHKQQAGAELLFLQYAGDAGRHAAFIGELRDVGCTLPVLPGIPVVIDHDGAAVLASFGDAVLPDGYVQRVLDAVDPFAEGVRAAIEFGQSLLALADVGGVIAAGGASPGQDAEFARALGIIARELGGGS